MQVKAELIKNSMFRHFNHITSHKWHLFIRLFLLLAALSSCQVIRHEPPKFNHNSALFQTYYPIEFTSFDGTKLRATVFQPHLSASQSAPVIIQLHAFAISRIKYPKSFMGHWLFSGEAAMQLWQRGYWVVSLDLRGHGDSEGMINLADPKQEIRDIQLLIDWISKNLPRVSQKQHDPLIGIIGDSYGAGIALLSSAQDSRIDSIVSANGWYDLKEALAPNQIPKIGWLMTPLFTGHFLNPGRMSAFFDAFYQDAVDNHIDHQYDQALEQRSLRYWCESNHPPQADVLILQGIRDILFDFNQGIGIRNCLQKTSNQYRLLGIHDGHLQPFLQWGGSNTFYHVESKLQCGNNLPINTQEAVQDWFNYTLRGNLSAGKRVPSLCISSSATTGVQLSAIPVGGTNIPLGLPIDSRIYRSSFTPKVLVSYIGKLRSGPTQPLIFPLYNVDNATQLVGTPKLTIQNHNPSDQKVNLFIGIGLIEKDKLSIINDQVIAIKSDSLNSSQRLLLKTLAIELKKGERLVCVIYAYQHRQGLSNDWWQTMNIQGEVSLPISAIVQKKTL